MKNISLGVGAFLLSTTLAFQSNAKEYIVKFKDASTLRQKAFNVRGLGPVAFLDTHEAGSIAKIELNQKGKSEVLALANLMKDPRVEYVTESFKVKLVDHAIDVGTLKEQWAIKKVEAEKAWSLAGNHGSQNVIVAIIDTGADTKHESLKDNIVAGYDFKDNDNDPNDEFDPNWHTTHKNPGHGTHCAGIVGATGLVNGGVVGLSPNVSIMPLKFIGIDGSGDLMAAIKAVDYAIEKKADVISASWGAEVGASQAQPLIDAVKRANDAGVIFVSAAGNGDSAGVGINNDEKSFYPANAIFENTITVAASDEADAKTAWSNFGRKSVQVASPGLKIMSTLPSNQYDLLSGTSMATPLVSGLVALLKAQNKSLTGMQVRSLIEQTGTKASIETACNCRVNAAGAMTALKDATPVLAPFAYTVAPSETVKFDLLNATGAVTFASSNPQVATIDANGTLTGVAEGETFVTATDTAGHTVKSESIFVWTRAGGNSGTCPLGDQATCDALCQIMPTLPFCTK
jgi:thermitase